MTYNPTNLTERELLPEVDPDLVQRVAWGLVGGLSKAEIARAEGISLEECQAIVIRPGMWALVSIWTTVRQHLHNGGLDHFAALSRWALLYFVRGAQRQNHPALWDWVDLCKRIRWLFGIPRVSRWLATYFEEIVSGGPRKKLPKWKLRLIQALSDAVEIASMDQMRSQYPNEALEVMVWKFRDHMMVAEVTDIEGRERLVERAEVLAKIGCEALPVPVQRFEESGDEHDWTVVSAGERQELAAEAAETADECRVEGQSLVGSVSTTRPTRLVVSVSRTATCLVAREVVEREPAVLRRGQPPPWLRLVHAVDRTVARGSPGLARPPDEAPILPMRTRPTRPPLVRVTPIGRAA